ncbi:MAG: hypothetical protein ACETWG_00565 [Candidatus Neomarinimicrobiota bacterium]
MLRYFYPVALLALVAFAGLSCDPETDNPGQIYPLAVGNTWEYTRQCSLYFYQDSTETPVYTDTSTYTSDVSVVITGKVTLREDHKAYALYSEENAGPYTHSGVDYYNNTDEGLYLYAYEPGGLLVLPKTQTSGRILFKGRTFGSVRELSAYLQAALPLRFVMNDSIYFEDPPVKVLQYPLKVGAIWTFREAENPWRIDKQVLAEEDFQAPAGEFSCYKIQWLYDFDEDEQWDEDITVFDYIAPEGLVYREITLTGSVWMDEYGNKMGYSDYFEEYALTEVSLE